MKRRNKTSQLTLEFLRDLLVPLFMIAFSIAIIFLLFIPLQRQTAEIKAKYEKEKYKVDKLEKKYKTITQYTSADLNSKMEILKVVVPDYINIAELAKVVNEINADYGLVVERLYLQQEQMQVETKSIRSQNVTLTVKVVTGPFRITGDKDKIFDFLNYLVTGPYATEFDSVRVSRLGDKWTAAFSVVLYYLPRKQNIDVYAPLIQPDWKVLDEVKGAVK